MYMGEPVAVLRVAKQAEGLDGFVLQFWGFLTTGYAAKDFARFRRAALRQHEQCFALLFGSAVAGEHFFEHRSRPLGVAVHQASNRKNLQFLVSDVPRVHRLAGGLPELHFARLAVVDPAALWEPAVEVGG